MKKIIWYVGPFSTDFHRLRYNLKLLHNVDCSFDQFGILEQADPIGSRYVLQQDLTAPKAHSYSDFELIERSVHAGLDHAWSHNKRAVVLYSGGIDSTTILSASLTHPKIQEQLKNDLFVVELNSMSIKELPSFFSDHISGKLKYRLFDFTKGPSETETYLGGDHGDVIFGSNTFSKMVDMYGQNFLSRTFPIDTIRNFYVQYDETKQLVEIADQFAARAPFKMFCAAQYVWWLDICTSFQREFLRSFVHSDQNVQIEKAVDPLYFYRTFGTQEMIHRGINYFANYQGADTLYQMKLPLRQYVYKLTKNEEILKKRKVHSQNYFARKIIKGTMYDNGTFTSELLE